MGVIMSKEFHRAIDVDGSLKTKAWDFLTKLSRDADLTGLDLKIPQGAIRQAGPHRARRPQLSCRAVRGRGRGRTDVVARGDQAPRRGLRLRRDADVLEVNPANGAMEVLAERGDRRERSRSSANGPPAEDAARSSPSRSPSSSDSASTPTSRPQAVRVTSEDDVLRPRRRSAGMAAAGPARARHRNVASMMSAPRTNSITGARGRRSRRGVEAAHQPDAVRLPRRPTKSSVA